MSKTVPMSRFIQSYNQHLSEAERTGDTIILQQRSGRPTWVLETEDRVVETQSATDFLAAALAALVHDDQLVGRFADALVSTLPWVAFLQEDDRRTFAEEAVSTLRACASIGRYAAFASLVGDWRNTAEIWSDPALARSLATPIDEPVDLPVDAV
ncbi:MAG: hypothetical protein LKI24_00065 [Acidipropionibacterium sp.]|jgi:xanthine/CO dehydrogenase XdhC/CoxF family maturation factor|nr:hypothetical protein [Acidipropionibacterium sp.]